MRIKQFKPSRSVAVASLSLLILGFFGIAGYYQLFFDPTDAIGAQIAAQTAAINQKVAAQPVDAPKPQEYYGEKRAQIALAEYRKNVSETKRGCNCGPEIDKYTQGVGAQWCTMFASWVTNEAGSPLYDEKTKSWRVANSRDFMINLQQNGTFYTKEEILAKGVKPRVGDYMVYYRGSYDDKLGHVDVVIDADTGDGRAGMIGGNLKDRIKYRELPYMEHYGFIGFGRPEKN